MINLSSKDFYMIKNVFKRLICTLTICISKQYVLDYVANCRIPLAHRTDLLIAEVVA